jgi:tRNA pseudouridine38-40 synthase
MPRYFLDVAYRGTKYSGFQIQENAVTIQSEIQKAFSIIYRTSVILTGSSRTDSGVHAIQNYFHFDLDKEINNQFLYKINAILPDDIAANAIYKMQDGAHSRFDAVSREYEYRLYATKSPFLKGLAFYYPYTLDIEAMQWCAALVMQQNLFTAFCKSNTQVTNFKCAIKKSIWYKKSGQLVYNIEANRFLRGMVRMLTATMLQVGRQKLSIDKFEAFFNDDRMKSTYSIGACGLYLKKVAYPSEYFD